MRHDDRHALAPADGLTAVPPTPAGSGKPVDPVTGILGLGRDVAWIISALVVNGAGTVLMLGYALRRIGTFDYGLFILASTVVTLLVVADFGLGTSVVLAVARLVVTNTEEERDKARADALTSHSVLVALGAVVTVGAGALAFLVPVIAQVPSAGWSAAVTMSVMVAAATGLAVATSALTGAVRGSRDFKVLSVAATAGVACRVILLVSLLGRLGLVALGIAELAGVATERALLALWIRRHLPWFVFRPRRFNRAALRRSAAVALPLVILAIDSQVVAGSDAIVVGAVVGAAAVAIYRVGSIAPAQAVQTIHNAMTAGFPALAQEERSRQVAIVRFLTKVWGFVAGVGFTLLVIFRREAVVLLLGHRNSTAELVLVLFSVTLAVDSLLHAMVLTLIARGRQGLLAALAPVELVVNLALTVFLVERIGASGAAWAAVASFLFLDLVLFPIVARNEFTPSVLVVLIEGLIALALGSLTCTVAVAVPLVTMSPSLPQAAIGVIVGCAGAGGAGLLLLGPSGRADLRATLRRPT